MANRAVVRTIMAGGVLAISGAAILIRLAEAAPVVTAFYRMGFAALLLVPFAAAELKKTAISKHNLGLMVLSGLFLALHFILWMTSLSFTSVTSSVVLVTTQPLFVALMSAILLKEIPRRRVWYGLLLAMAGSVIIAVSETGGSSQLSGNLMALGGAVMAAAYFLVGRVVRKDVSVTTYSFVVYGFSSVFLGLLAVLLRLPLTGYPTSTWGSLFLLALLPTLVGHTALNWALKYLPASMVSISILGEPLGASLLAFLILKETPALPEVIGGILILTGIVMTWWTPSTKNVEQGEAGGAEEPSAQAVPPV